MDLDKIKTIGVLGDRDSGKTNLMFYLARRYKGNREIVFYDYPKVLQYRQIHTLNELELLTSAVVFMDELQKHIKFYQKRMNEEFLDLLSTLAHNEVTLIFTTPMSQFINKSLDCFIDGFCYTRIEDLANLKNGSKAKRRLQEFSSIRISKRTLRLNIGEYLQIIDKLEKTNGLYSFPNQSIMKDWKNRDKNPKNKKQVNLKNA